MAGSSNYPGSLDVFSANSPSNLSDDDSTNRNHAERHDDMEAAMEAVQGELGINPAGPSASTVALRLSTLETDKADVASPTFTGTPAAPTAAQGTNTTQIATTAFVNTEIASDAVLLSVATAKGDLLAATGSGSIDNLAVGTNGQYLKALSSEAVGVAWGGLDATIGVACSDEVSALTTGVAKATFRMPHAMTLTAVRASVTTAPTGSALTVDINENGTSVLSTKLTIDATEKTSTTAATPAVISDSALADDAEITVDIDAVGSTIAGAGLKVWLIGTRA